MKLQFASDGQEGNEIVVVFVRHSLALRGGGGYISSIRISTSNQKNPTLLDWNKMAMLDITASAVEKRRNIVDREHTHENAKD